MASLASVFSPFADAFYIIDQLFSVLVSKNTGLLASFVSVLKNLSTPLSFVFTPSSKEKHPSKN
jgi:hypothetical protein